MKKTAVEGAGRTLESNNIRYAVVIDDFQKAIDSENPKEEDIEYQDRAGKQDF